jgi:hypothetical protein
MCEDFVYRNNENPLAATIKNIRQNIEAFGLHLYNFPYLNDIARAAGNMPLYLPNDYLTLMNLRTQVQQIEGTLNEDQRAIYNGIVAEVQDLNPIKHQYFLEGSGGTGKTYLYNAMLKKVASMGFKTMSMASTGIAATLLYGGKTAHSTFVLSRLPDENSYVGLIRNVAFRRTIQDCKLIIWDEAPMTNKSHFEELDRSLRHIMKDIDPILEGAVFGGKLIIFGGDWKQILPVIKRADSIAILNATLKMSYLWRHIQVLTLRTNMRIVGNDEAALAWRTQLDSIGRGVGASHDFHQVTLDRRMIIHNHDLNSLISFVYRDISTTRKAILTLTNKDAMIINDMIAEMLPGQGRLYDSIDEISAESMHLNIPHEFLNSLNPSGLSVFRLKLKVNMPVMLIRNVSQSMGLCNGTILKISRITPNLIERYVVNGLHRNEYHCIPRFTLPSDPDDHPFLFTRHQFPVIPAFAITINKSQGQTFDRVGIYLSRDVFSLMVNYTSHSQEQEDKKTLDVFYPDYLLNPMWSEMLLQGLYFVCEKDQ